MFLTLKFKLFLFILAFDLKEIIDIFRIFQFIDVEAWIFPLEIAFEDIDFMSQAEKKLYLLKEKAKEIKVEETKIIPRINNPKDIVIKEFQPYRDKKKSKKKQRSS
jgi:hypothetical protein